MTSKITYKCQYCPREYKLKTYYDRHILSCKFLCKSFKDLSREDKLLKEQLNNSQISELLMIYMEKCNKLEERLENIEKHYKIKNKINIIKWLENEYKNEKIFEIKDLIIDKHHYNTLKNNRYENAMVLILYNLFHNQKNIIAFNKKPNIFYIKKVNSWEIMNNKDFENIINYIQKNLIIFLNEFDNLDESNNSDLYQKNLEKILGINKKNSLSKIKKELYEKINISIDLLKYDVDY